MATPFSSFTLRTIAFVVFVCLVATPARSATDGDDALYQFNESVQSLVKRVSPAVVQVLVTGYGPVDNSSGGDTVLGRQRSLGSGAVIDPAGYIVTNAHVIAGGQHVEVVLSSAATDDAPLRSLTSGRGRTIDAKVVGVAREVDLALLKVEASGLPSLKLADYDELRTGELVFAFGSPEGLRNSVTMGVVSAVARQPDPDHPMVYIQTDAPINHGNSGGPLVNVRGELVGVNAFILSDSGGSQGLGFAIPSAVVNVACAQLRTYGQLHRGEIGLDVQTITPDMAHGLGLARDRGLVVSDLAPDGPAEVAGLRVQDVIVSVDGQPMDTLVELAFHLYTRSAGDEVQLAIMRGDRALTIGIPVVERTPDLDRLGDRIDPDHNFVRQLGILAIGIDSEMASRLSSLRIPFGVIVAARAQEAEASDVSLVTGDVIHTINGEAIANVDGLRSALDRLERKSPVVLQIERDGKLSFVAFELD